MASTSAMATTSASHVSKINVAVRVRPRADAEDDVICTRVHQNEPKVWPGVGDAFTFDQVFGCDASQATVFETCGRPLVEGCFEGFNATVLAYGQTGSGKTYTMGTGFDVSCPEEQLGIIPTAVAHLFDGIKKRKEAARQMEVPLPEFTVSVQFIEIYNETVRDLLVRNGTQLHLRENARRGFVVQGAVCKSVSAPEEVMALLRQGANNRATGATLMNAESSRSHAIFTLTLDTTRLEADLVRLTAKFNFVDLAGSERLNRTGATGDRARESISINSGLFHLGNVITALAKQQSKKKGAKLDHITYRDSKLTRVLQDSLGGNSVTILIACISPCLRDQAESLNTLQYANRAKNIKNKVRPNKGSPVVAQVQVEAEEEGEARVDEEEEAMEHREEEEAPEEQDESVQEEAGEYSDAAASEDDANLLPLLSKSRNTLTDPEILRLIAANYADVRPVSVTSFDKNLTASIWRRENEARTPRGGTVWRLAPGKVPEFLEKVKCLLGRCNWMKATKEAGSGFLMDHIVAEHKDERSNDIDRRREKVVQYSRNHYSRTKAAREQQQRQANASSSTVPFSSASSLAAVVAVNQPSTSGTQRGASQASGSRARASMRTVTRSRVSLGGRRIRRRQVPTTPTPSRAPIPSPSRVPASASTSQSSIITVAPCTGSRTSNRRVRRLEPRGVQRDTPSTGSVQGGRDRQAVPPSRRIAASSSSSQPSVGSGHRVRSRGRPERPSILSQLRQQGERHERIIRRLRDQADQQDEIIRQLRQQAAIQEEVIGLLTRQGDQTASLSAVVRQLAAVVLGNNQPQQQQPAIEPASASLDGNIPPTASADESNGSIEL